MSLTVKWGKERLHIALPSPDPKLGVIRQSLAEYTHVPSQNIKLIFGGGIMKDDTYPISAYGIGDGSTIHMVGTAELPPSRNTPAPPREAPQRPTESALITKIQEEIQRIRQSLVPPLDIFLGVLDPSQAPTSEMEREHIRLGELLLQSLLRLDALTPEGAWENARTLRKGAVREVQDLLTRLDDAWQMSKSHTVR